MQWATSYVPRSIFTLTHRSDAFSSKFIERNQRYPSIPTHIRPYGIGNYKQQLVDGEGEEEEMRGREVNNNDDDDDEDAVDANALRPRNTPALIRVLNQLRSNEAKTNFMENLRLDFEEESEDEEEEQEEEKDGSVYDSDEEDRSTGKSGLLGQLGFSGIGARRS